jgi:hypothetical protein
MRVQFTAVIVILSVALSVTLSGQAAEIKKEEVEYQNEAFESWWEVKLERKLSELPTEGKVPDYRIPYSGHDYPDRAGGVDARQRGRLSPLGKYDMAYNKGRGLAVAFERRDVTTNNRGEGRGGGLFGGRSGRGDRLENLDRDVSFVDRFRARRSVGWYGHCNGWTAAAIRHAEPQKTVVRNGVKFTPADIKGLLAELYMYSDTEFLGGVDAACNPATLHITLANWLGRGDHPVGMDTAVGKVVINYPIYAYRATITKRSANLHEVKMNVTYSVNTGIEQDVSPKLKKTMGFHYSLTLNDKGVITGGEYYGDSSRVDMLWTPLNPTQGGTKGNELGSPHLSAQEILAIYRDSVPKELHEKWMNIDPNDPEGEKKKAKEASDVKKPAAEKPAVEKTEKSVVKENE